MIEPTPSVRSTGRAASPLAATVAVVIVVVAVCSVALTLVGTPGFMVNDDLAMESFVSGDYTGSPSPYMVFTSGVIGLVLSTAYQLTDRVPWYALGLCAVQTMAFASIVALIWRIRRSLGVVRSAFVVSALVLAAPTMSLSLSFTAIGIWCGVAALIVLAVAPTASRPVGRAASVAGVAGLALAAALRWESFLAVAVVFAPTAAVACWRLGRRRASMCAAALVVLLTTGAAVDHVLHQRAGWPEFTSFNEVRGTLHGTPGLTAIHGRIDDPQTVAGLSSIGWTTDDLVLFDEWFFDDSGVYDREHLDELRQLIGEREPRRSTGESFDLVVDGRPWFVAAVVAAMALAVAHSGRRGRALVAVQSSWALAACLYTASTQRFPDRIAVPLLTGLAVVSVVTPYVFGLDRTRSPLSHVSRSPQVGRVTAVGAAVALVVLALVHSATDVGGSYSVPGVSRHFESARRTYDEQIDTLDGVDPEGRFVYAGAYVMVEGADPFARPGAYGGTRLLGVGWPTFSPLYEARREAMGLPGDLLEQLADQPHLYLVIGTHLVDVLERTYETRLGRQVTLRQLATLANGGGVFRVEPA